MVIRFLFYALCLLFFYHIYNLPVLAGIPVRLARHPALSPDGKYVAFSWRGAIWIAKATGGTARRVTSHPAYDGYPIWSHDGRFIAFASKRRGNYDVFVVAAVGGIPKQITYHSALDRPLFWTHGDREIVFHSLRDRIMTLEYKLYRVPVIGGMPQSYLPIHAVDAAISPNGQDLILVRGSHLWWRKRWKGPFHRHLWLYNIPTKTFKRLTPQGYSADSPSWLNGREIVFRSEKSGIFNIWKLDLATQTKTQLTHYQTTGLRSARASANGKYIVFDYWDRLMLMELATQNIRELPITASGDSTHDRRKHQIFSSKISEFAVSPDKKDIAFVIQGNIFVKALDDPGQWARRLAPSYWRERHLAWSPDGRTLAFVSDRQHGRDAIYLAYAEQRNGISIPLSQTLRPRITRLTHPLVQIPETLPQWSPDGRFLSFIRGRGNLIIRNMLTHRQQTVLDDWNLQTYQWSPDGRWFAFTRLDRESNLDVFLMPSDGSTLPINISRFPDSDISPVWSANGKILAFISHGINKLFSIRYLFLQLDDHEKSNAELKTSCHSWQSSWLKSWQQHRKHQTYQINILRKQFALCLQAIKRDVRNIRQEICQPFKLSPKPSSQPIKTTNDTVKPPKTIVKIDFQDLPFRIRSIPQLPKIHGGSHLAISNDGCRFFTFSTSKKADGLYQIDWNGTKLKRLTSHKISQISVHPSGMLFFITGDGKLFSLDPLNNNHIRHIPFRAEVITDHKISLLQKFYQGWTLIEQWFYDQHFHGVDWMAIRKRYLSLVSLAETQEDFIDVMHSMLGELNSSHIGISTPKIKNHRFTLELGISFCDQHPGPGLVVKSVSVHSPANRKHSRLLPGDIVLSIDGQKLSPHTNIYRHLNRLSRNPLVLRVQRKSGQSELIAIRPMSQTQARDQRYLAWVRTQRALVTKLSRGQLGYAHLRTMKIGSLDQFERDLFAHAHGKRGLILDLRNNSGGWIADLLLTMFFPRPHAFTRWRGSFEGYPVVRRHFYSWHKPTVLLINERSYSNSEIFAHAFKNLKRGLVIGMPSFGGVISATSDYFLDGSRFRLPFRGWWTIPSKINMENNPVIPDIIVTLSPQEELTQQDPQLIRAIHVLLAQTKKEYTKNR